MGMMPTYVEVWPVAADATSIWLVSGPEAWCSTLPVEADSGPHAEVELVLSMHGLDTDPALIHSTSWRRSGPVMILTYLVIVPVTGDVRAPFPDARPVGPVFTEAIGKPPSHGPADEPAPRDIDVLIHGLRHLAHLRSTNTRNAEAMDEHWGSHLDGLEPALAGLYLGQGQAA
jgi:hypothetical protein